jgi:hypothetical protein
MAEQHLGRLPRQMDPPVLLAAVDPAAPEIGSRNSIFLSEPAWGGEWAIWAVACSLQRLSETATHTREDSPSRRAAKMSAVWRLRSWASTGCTSDRIVMRLVDR